MYTLSINDLANRRVTSLYLSNFDLVMKLYEWLEKRVTIGSGVRIAQDSISAYYLYEGRSGVIYSDKVIVEPSDKQYELLYRIMISDEGDKEIYNTSRTLSYMYDRKAAEDLVGMINHNTTRKAKIIQYYVFTSEESLESLYLFCKSSSNIINGIIDFKIKSEL